MDSSLKVPYGQDQAGALVRADHADKTHIYTCPACAVRLLLKAGPRRVKHFAHQPSTTCTSEETLAHLIAKRLVAAAIERVARGEGPKQVFVVPCRECAAPIEKPLPMETFARAGLEVPIGAYRPDVVGFYEGRPRLAFEVLATHAVPESKGDSLGVPWVELSAADIIEDPTRWVPVRSRLKPTFCSACHKRFKEVREAARRCGVRDDLYSVSYHARQTPYVAAIETCWRCGHAITVFWWEGVPFCRTPPPEPRPATIQWRHSKTYGGSYWANTCPCGAVQGDNFLFLSPAGPFVHLRNRGGDPDFRLEWGLSDTQITRRMLRDV